MSANTITLSKPPTLSGLDVEEKRQQIKTYFLETWDCYNSLFELISDEQGFYERAEPLRHPLIFYYGHTAVFFINKLVLGKYLSRRVNQHIESTCAVGVDEMSWDDLNPNNYDWPTVAQVKDYRSVVKQQIIEVIDNMPLVLPIEQDSLAWVVLMGIEHERIHLETSSVIIRMLDLDFLTPHKHWPMCQSLGKQAPKNTLIKMPGGDITLGKPSDNDTYGWDNEYGRLDVTLAPFEASEALVSNGEYMEFINDGGYQTPRWWSEEGQGWLAYSKALMPRFWLSQNNEFYQRNLSHIIPLPLNWPVEVNYLEAKAFCNWKSEKTQQHYRLPVEAEWQAIRNTLKTDLADWQRAPGNINLEFHASSCPVDSHRQGEFFDIIGNVWQWTESPIDGYPGFDVHPLYDDFSTPTFDGKHNLIKGGSWISTGNEATRDSRYAFRRHFFQHAGFRYVRSDSAATPVAAVNPFETQTEISQLLHHHFAQNTRDGHPEFSAVAKIASDIAKRNTAGLGRALDMGCGAGRLSFELAKTFDAVDGIDFTARHIQHCLQFKEQGSLRFATPQLGELLDYHDIDIDNFGLGALSHKVNFAQGDGHNLKPQFDNYDVIVCHDVLEHTYTPHAFISALLKRLKSNGYLIISSAYQWHQHDNPSAWLGGFKANGENVETRAHIAEVFADQLSLIERQEIERRFRLNRRSEQLSQLELTVWRKI